MRARAVEQAHLDDEHAALVGDEEFLGGFIYRQLGDMRPHYNVRSETRDRNLADNLTSTMIL